MASDALLDVMLSLRTWHALPGVRVGRSRPSSAHAVPYGQKTRNQLDNRVYDPAIAHSATCILSTPSRILGPREGRTNSGGQTHGLEDTARVYHRDRRSRTAVAQ